MITVFTTASGTTYKIYEDTNTLVRIVSPAKDRSESAGELRRDGEHIPILERGLLKVGYNAEFALDIRRDGIPTIRSTNIVSKIWTED